MKHVAIFDLDGTLVDTPRAIVDTFVATFESLGEAARDAADIRATIGRPLEQAFAMLLGIPSEDARVGACVGQYQVLFREVILPRAETLVFPGVVTGLTALRNRQITLAVATNKFYSSAEALLKAANLWDYFSVVVGADQVCRPKPHPESGYIIMQRLDIPADRAVMVGDTTHDLLMVKAAGMRSVAVTYGIHDRQQLQLADPTWVAESFDEAVTAIVSS